MRYKASRTTAASRRLPLTDTERKNRKREAARIRQQRCRARKREHASPQLSLPQLSLPQLSLPQLSLPQLSLPHLPKPSCIVVRPKALRTTHVPSSAKNSSIHHRLPLSPSHLHAHAHAHAHLHPIGKNEPQWRMVVPAFRNLEESYSSPASSSSCYDSHSMGSPSFHSSSFHLQQAERRICLLSPSIVTSSLITHNPTSSLSSSPSLSQKNPMNEHEKTAIHVMLSLRNSPTCFTSI